jgi:hypothetical protein
MIITLRTCLVVETEVSPDHQDAGIADLDEQTGTAKTPGLHIVILLPHVLSPVGGPGWQSCRLVA